MILRLQCALTDVGLAVRFFDFLGSFRGKES